MGLLLKKRKAMREYQTTDGPKESEFVFHVAGCRAWKFNRVWRKAAEAANLRHRLFHDYRRTAVRDLVRSGVPQSVAMAQTGHKTPAVFQRYNITSTADLENAVDRLAAFRAARNDRHTDRRRWSCSTTSRSSTISGGDTRPLA